MIAQRGWRSGETFKIILVMIACIMFVVFKISCELLNGGTIRLVALIVGKKNAFNKRVAEVFHSQQF